MKKLLKYQLMHYRSIEMKVFLVLPLLVALLGWLSHHLLGVPAGGILIVIAILYAGILSAVAHYTQYLYSNPMEGSLPLLIPIPYLWSLFAGLLASLPAGGAVAASYFALTLAFRQQPGIQLLDGWQWLMLTGIYILAQSAFVCLLAAYGALKGRLVLPKKLGVLSRIARWGEDETVSSLMFSTFISLYGAFIVIIPLIVMMFNEHIAISRALLALIVYASSSVLLYTASYLLEKYSNY
ncbi:MAG: hypothetical protein DDT21_01672 [Syntrophomonadaceae bacterium]|nr:hypothetical protein [Bacillota bacterium]